MKSEARMKLFWRGYVCISPRRPLPPLDLELYSRATQEARSSPFDPELRPKILDAAADKETFTALLDDLQKNKSRLDFLNVVTLLHRVGKYRMTLSAEILTYITEQIFLMPVYERLKGQQFGIILYGFQKLGDSPEVRPTALSS